MTTAPLTDAYRRFGELLSMAEARFAAGDASGAVGLAQIAVRYVFPGKGIFASPRLERLLLEIGRQIPTDPRSAFQSNGRRARNVLHVLTHARLVGGDSRYVWRWMQQDDTSRHSVAITAQDAMGHHHIPQEMKDAAQNSGGFLQALSAPTSKPLEQARELRRLCQGMDVVALHLFPYDIIPVLALAAGCDSFKTLYVNHADHTLWIGASVAHSVVHLRRQSPEFLKQRRALDPDQAFLLPIPLVPSARTTTREQAKRALGYDPDTVLLLTIASRFKYSSPGHIGFLELVTPVLSKLPQARLVAVGPPPEGAWQSAAQQTDGRIAALGARWDTELLYAAADVYLDSVPFSSITSLIEAGSCGTPLLGYRPADPELELLGPGTPGLDDAMVMGMDAASYRALLARLIEDREYRELNGRRVQEQIASRHSGANWLRSLQDIYAKLDRIPERKCLIGTQDVFEIGPLNLALARLYSSVPFRESTLIREFLGALPYRSRASMSWRLHRLGLDLCYLNLLPPPADRVCHSVGRRAKKVLRQITRTR